jgi:hypothetical protein
MQNLVTAIQIINPNAEFSINADLEITWLGDTEPILQSEIEQKIAEAEFENEMKNLRIERNQKLAATDFRALSDQTLSQEWTNYRQQLRDITQNLATTEDVKMVIWPTLPA